MEIRAEIVGEFSRLYQSMKAFTLTVLTGRHDPNFRAGAAEEEAPLAEGPGATHAGEKSGAHRFLPFLGYDVFSDVIDDIAVIFRAATNIMTVTIHQIAAHVGLSAKTVSRILGDPHAPHRAETCERVRVAARELGYRPNRSARAMRTRRAGSVALLLSTVTHRSVLSNRLREGVQAALAEHALHLLIASLPDARLTDEEYLPQVLREWATDGLLINYNADVPAAMPAIIARHAIPSVWINTKREADCVHPDDFGAAREATERLIALGHRRIGFVEFGGVTHYSAVDRREACHAALAAANLGPPEILEGGGAPATRAEQARAWLQRPAADRPTAVLAYGADLAPPIIYAAALCGVQVPRDLSVITVADEPDTSLGRPISTFVLPQELMGRTAVGMLVEKMTTPDRLLPPRTLPLVFAPGSTLGPPPES